MKGVKKLAVTEEGMAAPSNSEMMVSLSGTSGREVTKSSKPVMVVVICTRGSRYRAKRVGVRGGNYNRPEALMDA